MYIKTYPFIFTFFASLYLHNNNNSPYLLENEYVAYANNAAMVMESLTRANNQSRLMDIEQTLSYLQQLNLIDYMTNPNHRKLLMEAMDVNLIAFRQIDADGIAHTHTFCDDDSDNVEVSAAAFDCLNDTYGQVCRDYGVVFVDEARSNSRKAVVEVVQWGGDPDKTLKSDGTLSPRSSFASFMKGHLKKGKPWDDDDKQRVRRFAERIEKYTSTEVVARQNEAIQSLGQEKKDLIQDQKENVSNTIARVILLNETLTSSLITIPAGLFCLHGT